MKRSRFTQEQIIGVLKEHQAGASAPELCRKHGIAEATFYAWWSKYGGMEVSDAKRLRGLEEGNARLKKLLAESMLDVSTLREMLVASRVVWKRPDRVVSGVVMVALVRRRGQQEQVRRASRRASAIHRPCAW